ncbi:hypothetical protein MTR67_025110 [Solanum verrucosum]|uniref:Uncharacterized protein n=1 Tax=Solanum verrucosum TaxID=315347 RepID=A0AAF0R2Y1_SOLVR|nr:hypothetical protein MTR67_025110 [Solanum verrucosum]
MVVFKNLLSQFHIYIILFYKSFLIKLMMFMATMLMDH